MSRGQPPRGDFPTRAVVAVLLCLCLAAGGPVLAQMPGVGASPPAQAATTVADGTAGTRLPPDWTFEEFVAGSGAPATRRNLAPLAVGAVLGVAVFSLVGATLAAPLAVGMPAGSALVTESALAASQFYTVASAVLGAWGGSWLYENVYEKVGTR